MNNEVEIEELDKNMREAKRIGTQYLENLTINIFHGRLFFETCWKITTISCEEILFLNSGADNEMKYDNLARSLAMMEDELKRSNERVKNAESRVGVIESELQNIGENQKQLEISEEKARKREEKYQVSCDWPIAI